ncbi:Acetoacetyl-CoA synthetase [Cyphellophora attinorum]|uniref:Acetoacetyl-CoA synthetase n=1 Tax=Cyphellophora attinorum TaxID=1664694 RepID=A0A0N0NLX2_9EURO|nr:Acetoacetyl-CoA synthetase [Phialophora attinorum]KPI39678.1 Acetoacetyl-CoA synthetase [Phialophora attinorum]
MDESDSELEAVWQPVAGVKPPLQAYREHVNAKFKQNFETTQQLYRWTVDRPHDFWIDLYQYIGLMPALPPSITKAYDDTLPMSQNPQFFPKQEINYAENILFANPNPQAPALIEVREDQDVYNDKPVTLSWAEFREAVRKTASALRRSGIKQGDRVAALVATSNWAVTLFQATASIGAIFTIISPEIGTSGCVSRLAQVSPSILFVDSHLLYKGKLTSIARKVEDVVGQLDERPQVFTVPVAPAPSKYDTIDAFLSRSDLGDGLTFKRVPFNFPLLICYSSGTTGQPKCIVHHHGCILNYKKISAVQSGLRVGDVVAQSVNTSWVVFYVMCSHLAVGATLLLYNGSPLYPDAKQFLRIADKYRATYMGLSPRLLLEMEITGSNPKREFDLSQLRLVYTTGSPLSVEQYRWFKRSFHNTTQICNAAGGTDTATSILALDPCAPVYAGQIQVPALGMAVDILDDNGQSIAHTGEPGEMVIRKPFPSMPCFFWGDKDNSVYRAAYFERFDEVDVWAQHDWVSRHPKTGGYVMHGRSDSVLNPSGVRFGSGEIYAIVETSPFTDYIHNTLCVGRRRPRDVDEQVFLLLQMRPGVQLTAELKTQIKDSIRAGLSRGMCLHSSWQSRTYQ